MRPSFLPYAASPGRLVAQLLSDAVIAAWTWLWLLVGLAVHAAISAIGQVGRQVQTGAQGVAGNPGAAGSGADRIPLVGDTIAKPLTGASAAAMDIATAGQNLNSTAGRLAVVLAVAVAAPPIAALGVPWLMLRLRFLRRKRAALALSGTPAGRRLLALRALTGQPLRRLTAISPDPAGAWRRDDPEVIRDLAGVELRSAGLVRRR